MSAPHLSPKKDRESEISLQSVVDAHLQRLSNCQTGVLQCHAGLLGLGEADMEQYRSKLPPLPTAMSAMSFLQSCRQARAWLAANALRDVITLHIFYFEQMRQFLGLARIIGSEGSEDGKKAEAQAMVADKPADTALALERLDEMLGSSWPRKPEFRALETLYSLFAALASSQKENLPSSPVIVTLCRPQIEGRPSGGELAFEVRRVTKTYARADEAEADRDLFYEIFFTAFVICKETAEAVSEKLAAKPAAQEPGNKVAVLI